MKSFTAWLGTFKHTLLSLLTPLKTRPRLKWAIVISVIIILIIIFSFIGYTLTHRPPQFVQSNPRPTYEKTHLPHPQEVIAVLSRMAYERDLRYLEFETHNSLGGTEVLIRAALDVSSQSILKRMLAQFYKQYQTAIPIVTAITPTSNQLPFTISEVITGPMASIVTTEGKRVFIGDRIHGYQLVRIEPGKLVFVGDQHIEIAW